jgi:hypothetical protein
VGKVRVYEHLMDFVGTLEDGEIIDQTSGWSNTQTASIPANIPLSPTPAPSSSTPASTTTPATSNPTSTANQSGTQMNWLEIGAFAVLGITVVLLVVVIAFMHRRIRVLELKQG